MEIPKYISSFELEEARLGQALQRAKLESHNQYSLNQKIITQILRVIKDQSINLEYAIVITAEKNEIKKDEKEMLLEFLEKFLLVKK